METTLLLTLASLIVMVIAAAEDSKFRWKRRRYVMPWKKGPNVCAVEEVMGTRQRYYSECMSFLPRTIRGKPTFIRYHCCTGYERDGTTKGCQGVTPMSHLMDTAKHLYLKDFRQMARASGHVDDTLQNDGAFTVFAPHNHAFQRLPKDDRKKMIHKRQDRNLLMYHVARDRYYTEDLHNKMEIPTLHGDQDKLRINRYSNGIVTVNCARIILPNQPATNGILHVLEKYVKPYRPEDTVMQQLLEDDRFGEFVTALIVTGLANELRVPGDFTIFAPTDEAFANAPPAVIERTLGDKDVLKKLLQYHMVERSYCSPAILKSTTLKSREGQKVNISFSSNDRLTVNGGNVVEEDKVASNGVIHAVDTLLIPDSVKSLGEKLTDLGLDEFRDYAQAAGMRDILEATASGQYTFFAPSAAAFRNLTVEQRRILQSQPEAAKRVFSYHVTPGRLTTRGMMADQTVESRNSGTLRVNLTVHAYNRREFGVNGAKITKGDFNAKNGVVHIVDSVIFPPEGDVTDKVNEQADLSTFMSMVKEAGLDKLLLSDQAEGQYTVFAPTNDAFDAMETSRMEKLLSNKKELQQFMNYHVVKNVRYCKNMDSKLRYRYKTLAGEWVSLRKSGDEEGGHIVANDDSKVLRQDLESANGVIHVVDKVFTCPCQAVTP